MKTNNTKKKKNIKDRQAPSKGFGDTVEKVFDATGITKIVNKITKGKPCGCAKRKAILNKIIKY